MYDFATKLKQRDFYGLFTKIRGGLKSSLESQSVVLSQLISDESDDIQDTVMSASANLADGTVINIDTTVVDEGITRAFSIYDAANNHLLTHYGEFSEYDFNTYVPSVNINVPDMQLGTIANQINDSAQVNQAISDMTTRVLNYGQISVDSVSRILEQNSTAVTGTMNDMMAMFEQSADADGIISAQSFAVIVQSLLEQTKKAADSGVQGGSLTLDTTTVSVRNFVGTAILQGITTVLQYAGLFLIKINTFLGFITTTIGWLGSQLVSWFQSNVVTTDLTINMESATSYLETPIIAMSVPVANCLAISQPLHRCYEVTKAFGGVAITHVPGLAIYTWVQNDTLYINGFVDVGSYYDVRHRMDNPSNVFCLIEDTDSTYYHPAPYEMYKVWSTGDDFGWTGSMISTHTRDEWASATEQEQMLWIAKSMGSIRIWDSALLDDGRQAGGHWTAGNTRSVTSASYQWISGTGHVRHNLGVLFLSADNADYTSSYQNFTNLLAECVQFDWTLELSNIFYFMYDMLRLSTDDIFQMTDAAADQYFDADCWSLACDGVPTDRFVKWPRYTKKALLHSFLLVASIAAVTAATFAVGRTLYKKWSGRSELKNIGRLQDLREDYLADPSKENYKKLYKATKKYNFKAKMFGWYTYDMNNDWCNEPGGSEPDISDPVDTSGNETPLNLNDIADLIR